MLPEGTAAFGGVPAGPGPGNVRTCDGLRCRTARTDGAARSRYQSGGPGGTRSGGRPPAPRMALPANRGEPAGRRNRPPEHQHEAGRRGPSDGGSRMPFGQWKKVRKEPGSDRLNLSKSAQVWSPEGPPQVLRSIGPLSWSSVFPKTGFLKSCGRLLGVTG